MEVRPGYKQTEVGVIPEDWDVASFEDVFNITAGADVDPTRSKNFQDEIHRYPIYSNALTNYGLYGYCSYADHPAGSLTITARGTVGFAKFRDHAYTAIGRVLVLQPKFEVAGVYFAEVTNNRVKFANESTGVPQLTAPQISKYRLPVPPLAEQCAIAAALSDVDALLGGLERLIAKKRELKQAAMQQLLSGQTRLPGFSGEWEVKRLGDHLTFLKNGVNSRAELTADGKVKYLHYGDIHGATGFLLNPSVISMPHLPVAKAGQLDRMSDGDLVFADASEDLDGVGKSVELKSVGQFEVVSGLHTIAVRFDKQVLADGFKAYLQFIPGFRQHLRRLAAGTKVYATNRAHIASAEISLPDVQEQTAIAAVLSDMDAELSALVARRDKTRAVKQAMMQELLTGRTRLL